MEVGIVIVCGICLGLIYIYKSVRQAGEDMETFDSVSLGQKFKRPEGWRVGKMPSELNSLQEHSEMKRTA